MSEGERPDTWAVIDQGLAKGGRAHHDFEGGDIDQRHVPEECRICRATAMLATLKADARRLVAEYDRTHAALAAALAREQRKDEALLAIHDYDPDSEDAWDAFDSLRLIAREALAAVPVETQEATETETLVGVGEDGYTFTEQEAAEQT